MLSIRNSRAKAPAKSFVEIKRGPREDNLAWIRRNLARCRHETLLILVGGKDAAHVRLRLAQAQARHDLSPSHWSHVMLSTRADLPAAWEVPLVSTVLAGFPPATNGVQRARLRDYAKPDDFPNIALISVAAKAQDMKPVLARFQKERSSLDAVELKAVWLAFLWAVGHVGNPLLDAQGMPSAAMVEYVLGALGLDLTPGLNSRSSCPEAIWQSARWWHEYHARENGESLDGAWTVTHYLAD